MVLRAGFPSTLRVRSTGEAAQEKRRLRSEVLAIRDNLNGQHRRQAAQLAAGHLSAWLDRTRHGLPVGAFINFASEIDMSPLLAALQWRGMRVGLPVVQQKGHPLVFRRLMPFDSLAAGAFGIPAPRAGAPLIQPELFLVPFAAFDRQGFRIGYGGGFYDRTLAEARSIRGRHVLAIGYGYSAQEVPRIPRERHDLPMDGIVTENGLGWFSSNGIGPVRQATIA
ncbi:MAG: 5-formyltetrahydrofolate cyclo-ligase [Pseudomonadota bacterium]